MRVSGDPITSKISSAHVLGCLLAGIGQLLQTRSSHKRQSVQRSMSVVSIEESILCSSAAKTSCSSAVNGAKRDPMAARRPLRSSSRRALPRLLR